MLDLINKSAKDIHLDHRLRLRSKNHPLRTLKETESDNNCVGYIN